MRPRVRVLVLAGLALAAPTALARAESAGEALGAGARRILADPRFQRELPRRPVEVREAAGRRVPVREPEPVRISLPELGNAGAVARLLGQILLFVSLLVFLLWLIRLLVLRAGPQAPPEPGPREEASPPAREEARAPSLEEAQRLARAGSYVEALHQLLLAAIQRFAERGKRGVEPHLTSRELARLLPLGPDSRQAFRDLVATVEGPLFGGASAGAEDFARAVERYQSLVEGRPHGT